MPGYKTLLLIIVVVSVIILRYVFLLRFHLINYKYQSLI